MDIAEIGFAANTAELADAKAKLDALSPAAGRAERAAAKLNQMLVSGAKAATASARADLEKANAVLSAAKATTTATAADVKAAAAARATAKATYDAARAAQARVQASVAAAAAANKEAQAVQRLAAAAQDMPATRSPGFINDNDPAAAMGASAGAMRANVGNIAAQFQDIGVTAAMGMNPMLIALQQGTQLSAVFAGAGGLGAVKGALLSLISPVSLMTIGLVALAAAGLQMVDWTGAAQWALNGIAAILPQVASGVALLGTAIALAFAPAIMIAFYNTVLIVAAGIAAAIGGIVAAIGAIPLAIGLIIADLYIFRDEWTALLGVDLIGVAKDAANYIIGAFVGAYNDILFIWQQFPTMMGAAAVGAVNAAIRAINVLIAHSVNALNTLIAGANAVASLGGLVDGPQIGMLEAPQFEEFANQAATNLESAVKDRNAALKDALTTDYLGAMGEAVTGAATGAAAKLKEFSAGLSVDETKKSKGGGGGGKTEGEKFEDIVSGAERSIASMQAERDAIGLNAEATARLKYETELLNQAKQKNIALSPEQRAQLMGLAAEMANLETETNRAKEALDFAKDATKGFVSDFVGGLRQGKSVWEAFSDAATNALNKIIDKLLNQFIDAIFSANSAASSLGGGAGGGGGGILGGIFGGIMKLFGFAKGGAFSDGVQAFAKGGTFTNSVVDKPTLFKFAKGGAMGMMGEAGPEAIMPLKRGPDGSLGVQMHGGEGGGGSTSIVIAPVINVEGGSGDKNQNQDQAVKISEAVTDAVNKIVDERMMKNTQYGGMLNQRGVRNA